MTLQPLPSLLSNILPPLKHYSDLSSYHSHALCFTFTIYYYLLLYMVLLYSKYSIVFLEHLKLWLLSLFRTLDPHDAPVNTALSVFSPKTCGYPPRCCPWPPSFTTVSLLYRWVPDLITLVSVCFLNIFICLVTNMICCFPKLSSLYRPTNQLIPISW